MAFDDDQQNSAEQVQLRAYWLSFIKTAGIDKEYSVFYASIFLVRFCLGTTATTTRFSHLATGAPTNCTHAPHSHLQENELDGTMLGDIDHSLLVSLGVKKAGHRIKIIRFARLKLSAKKNPSLIPAALQGACRDGMLLTSCCVTNVWL